VTSCWKPTPIKDSALLITVIELSRAPIHFVICYHVLEFMKFRWKESFHNHVRDVLGEEEAETGSKGR